MIQHITAMVVNGPFEVSLVRADTKEPFKEHTHESGDTYVEVEPDMEYFIRIKSTYPETESLVRADFMLDGVGLDYYTIMTHGEETLHGLWTVQGNTQIEKALCFHCEELEIYDSDKIWFGSLEMTFSEAIRNGSRITTRNVTNQWTGGIVDGCIPGTKNKVVKSKEGSLVMSKETLPKRRTHTIYRPGKELAKIKLYYCTALGLIKAGILPQPPLWDFHRSSYPRLSPPAETKMTPSMIRCLNVSPQRIVVTPGNEELQIPEVIVDFFDLVEADDSSIDEGDEQSENELPRRKLDFEADT
jgi:hypothetical protein